MICFQKFIDYVGELLQAYVDRREQVTLGSYKLYKRQFCYMYILCQQTTGFCMNVLLDLHCVIELLLNKEEHMEHIKNKALNVLKSV